MHIELPPHYRYARISDDHALGELVNLAGEGMPFYLWSKLATTGQDPWEIGRERARRERGSFSYRNGIVREEGGKVLAALIGYPIDDNVEPANYADMPAMFVPLQQLEDMAAGTWYVNVLATYPPFQGRGFGSDLLAIAERIAEAENKRGLSIIVADSNRGARRLYERLGYREQAKRTMVKDGWESPGTDWVLLIKNF